jgi:hypothetical protein
LVFYYDYFSHETALRNLKKSRKDLVVAWTLLTSPEAGKTIFTLAKMHSAPEKSVSAAFPDRFDQPQRTARHPMAFWNRGVGRV